MWSSGWPSEDSPLIAGAVYRWVHRFLPLFLTAARAYRRLVGSKWRVDETYTRLEGARTYMYRAIDQDGQAVDAYFSQRRNAKAAQPSSSVRSAETGVRPEHVTTDKAKCYPPALRVVLPDVEHRRSRYLNNGFERDHSHLKQRLYPMRGFKQPPRATAPTARRPAHLSPARRMVADPSTSESDGRRAGHVTAAA
jgi:transposase-like protein